jgi:hypothetical protein
MIFIFIAYAVSETPFSDGRCSCDTISEGPAVEYFTQNSETSDMVNPTVWSVQMVYAHRGDTVRSGLSDSGEAIPARRQHDFEVNRSDTRASITTEKDIYAIG